MDRLHEKGYILDPKSKAKSVVMTPEGARRARELFEKHFVSGGQNTYQR
jgi:Mn-dependent DtxR family transcriptional regulator